MDEMNIEEALSLMVVQAQAQGSANLMLMSEIRVVAVLQCLAIGLFALVNNWPVVGIPAFVLAAVALYAAVNARCNARRLIDHCQTVLKKK